METTIFNIVNVMQQFHSDLADYYFAQKENTHDTRVLALLDYLGRSERYLENYVDSHRQLLPKETLKTRIRIPSKTNNNSILNLDETDIPDRLDKYDKAMFFAIRMDAMLINFCKIIKVNAGESEISKVFKNLCTVTRREKRNLFTYNNMFGD